MILPINMRNRNVPINIPNSFVQDKNPDNRTKAEEQFKNISEAYDVSSNAET